MSKPQANQSPESTELRLVTRLFAEEAARLLEWLAGEIARGEVVASEANEERRFRPHGELRTTVRADKREHGGRVRLEMEWESELGGSIDIQPS